MGNAAQSSTAVKKPKNKKQEELEKKYFELLKKHPGICKKCGGDGCMTPDVESDEDDDLDLLTFYVCEKCLLKGKCPKCNGELKENWKEELSKELEDPQDKMKCPKKKCWRYGDDMVLPDLQIGF